MELMLAPTPTPRLTSQAFEVVERKGVGHPDTISDALAEAFSGALSRWYLEALPGVDKSLIHAESRVY